MDKLGTSKHLVIGLGEIGKAVKNVLSEKYEVSGIDANDVAVGKFDVLHICFPPISFFVDEVNNYKSLYLVDGGLVIIHSTVPIGTTEKIVDAVHSPVRGIHPHLEDGIRTFTKYFGGARAWEASGYFNELGIRTVAHIDARNTEALKIWDTTIYGWNILIEKEIFKFCQENGLNFDMVYTDSATSYNDGYEKLGHPEYKKYVLKQVDGEIGGHCVIQNCQLLNNPITKFILEQNEKWKNTKN